MMLIPETVPNPLTSFVETDKIIVVGVKYASTGM